MTLATWAHKRDPKIARAKARLATVPTSSTGNGVAVPWTFIDRSFIKKKHTNKEINAAIRAAKIVTLDLDDDLYAIQHSVKEDQVRFYLDHPDARDEGHQNEKSKTPDDYPIVIQQGGKKVIWDGHHRLTADELAGRHEAEVRLVDFDE